VDQPLRPARRRLAAAKAEQARTERAVAVGRDGLSLLEAVYGPDAPAGLAGVEAVQVLRATWIQQFYLHGGQVRWRDKRSGLPPGSRIILSPTTWMPGPASNAAAPGAATRPTSARPVSLTGPTRVTQVATTDAATADLDTVQGRHADLAARDLLPEVHLVDGAMSASGRSWPRPTTMASS
jgi:hypothetical protein